MTQITEYNPLDDGDSESGVLSCPKKYHNHVGHFLSGHGVMLYRGNRIFAPLFN